MVGCSRSTSEVNAAQDPLKAESKQNSTLDPRKDQSLGDWGSSNPKTGEASIITPSALQPDGEKQPDELLTRFLAEAEANKKKGARAAQPNKSSTARPVK